MGGEIRSVYVWYSRRRVSEKIMEEMTFKWWKVWRLWHNILQVENYHTTILKRFFLLCQWTSIIIKVTFGTLYFLLSDSHMGSSLSSYLFDLLCFIAWKAKPQLNVKRREKNKNQVLESSFALLYDPGQRNKKDRDERWTPRRVR